MFKYKVLVCILLMVGSNYYFHGVGVNSERVKWQKASIDAKKKSADILAEKEQAWRSRQDELLLKIKQSESQRKPIAKEIIRYVAEDKSTDDSQCAITADGLQFVTKCFDVSFNSEN